MSSTQVFGLIVVVIFPLWLYWMANRAKNPILIAVFGIPAFSVIVLILWLLFINL